MTWSNKEIEYEGLPLLLRRPDCLDIKQYRNKLSKLVAIEHQLESVAANGLPEAKYNATLAEFGHFMTAYFDKSDDGIILFVETFSGMRNYYYYTMPHFDANVLVAEARSKFEVNLDSWVKPDPEWEFLDKYPVKIF